MNKVNKILLGKILGEVYRLQKCTFCLPCLASDGRIYGLLNGIEREVDLELEEVGFVSDEKLEAAERILEEYFDERKLEEIKSYGELEKKLSQNNIDKKSAVIILKYLYTQECFAKVIEKIDSIDLPIEFQNLNLDEYDF